ncbi:hypothetical protein [Legionella cincinnatiensis]|uniref:Transmembrane protein n=1 Tax=Legionella cincinnatiensis TaxID=28085 RepID=A0A378ITU4_9GAMM|nr:hypothetical protein [Legionella cincinnatiensis]KTC89101.1 transmembrane protein [Legionella cincinnatiensis]STX35434.1 transmembrane protein [Legionella cincinnatiensis]
MPRHHHNHPGHTHVPPHVHVHAHPHMHGRPHVHVFPPIRPSVHVHRGYTYYGSGALLISAAILIPAIILALLLSPTVGVAGYAASSMTLGAASVGAATAFSAATFGLGALALYGAIGLAYLYSSAKECYSGNKSMMDMMHSRVVNEDGFTVKGVLKSIGAVVWSPFLLIGGLAGMGVKAAVNAFNTRKSSAQVEPTVENTTTSDQVKDLGLSRKSNEPTAPFHTKSVFATLDKKTEEDLTHNTSSTLRC